MAKLPNPPKSKRLTKKVGLECLAILNEIDRVLFDHRILELPCLWERMREATGTEDPDNWVREMHDRVIAACANLWAWRDEEFRRTNALRRKRYATEYVGMVSEEGDTCYAPRYMLNPKLKAKAEYQSKQGPYVITRVAPDGMTRLFLTEFTPVCDGRALYVEDTGWMAIKDAAVEFPSHDCAKQIMDGIIAGEKSDSKLGKMWVELKHGATPRRRRSNASRGEEKHHA